MTTRETALLVIFGLLAVYSVNASATGNGPQETRVNVYANQQTTVTSANSATSAAASARASGGNAAANGGTASATGGSGGAVVVNMAGTTGRRATELRTVGVAPDISANATAPCRIALGAGGGWIGGALSIFGSVLDEGCEARSDAAMLMMIGKPEAAVKRLCARPELAKALGCEALGE